MRRAGAGTNARADVDGEVAGLFGRAARRSVLRWCWRGGSNKRRTAASCMRGGGRVKALLLRRQGRAGEEGRGGRAGRRAGREREGHLTQDLAELAVREGT